MITALYALCVCGVRLALGFLLLATGLACSPHVVSLETVWSGPENPTINKIAILPLVNRANRTNAAESVRLILEERLRSEGIEVVELPSHWRLDPELLERGVVGLLAKELKVDAMMQGSVFAFGYTAGVDPLLSTNLPTLRADLQLIDQKGAVIWMAQVQARDERGYGRPAGTLTRLLDEAIEEASEDLVGQL